MCMYTCYRCKVKDMRTLEETEIISLLDLFINIFELYSYIANPILGAKWDTV